MKNRALFYTSLITVGLSLSVVILAPSQKQSHINQNSYKLVKSQTGFDLEIKDNRALNFVRLNLNANVKFLSDKKKPYLGSKKS